MTPSDPSASPAVKTALRWLIGQGLADGFQRSDLYRYYERNGQLTRTGKLGRRGAAGRMLYRLEGEGYVGVGGGYNGPFVVTRAGRRAAQ